MKKTLHIFTRALIALAFAAISAGAWAGPRECGIVGTWGGADISGGTDIMWLGVHTPGTSDSRGAMILEWIYVNPGLIPPGYQLSPGRGVWEQTGKGAYKYTWYAYVSGLAGGMPVGMVRVGGTATNNGCDTITITYLFEIFDFSSGVFYLPNTIPADAVPLDSTAGSGEQYRVPLVTLPPGP